MGFPPHPVVPVAPAGCRLGPTTDGKPLLRSVTKFEVVGCTCSTHPGGYPARIHGVAQHVGVQSGECGGESCDKELAVRVGSALPGPVDTVQGRVTAEVGATAEIDQPARKWQ